MKKTILLIAAALMAAGAANAQEAVVADAQNVGAADAQEAVAADVQEVGPRDAFKHLSIGLEAATTGIGLELAMPVVTNHLVLTAGYNFGNFGFTLEDSSVDLYSLSCELNDYVYKANDYLAQIPGEGTRLIEFPSGTDVDGDGSVKLGTMKLGLEYYPSKRSGFHINAGLLFGSADVVTLNASMSDYWTVYSANVAAVREMKQDHPDYSGLVGDLPEAKFSMRGRTFQLKDSGNVNVGLEVAKVRPYAGLGFGRSIPNHHVGFQFDLGAVYFGKLAINSTNEVSGTCDVSFDDETIDKVLDIAEKVAFYPQISFRLIYRIF